jgi:hypothetical protein
MKAYLLFGVAMLALVSVASAGWSLDFQNSPDFSEHVQCVEGATTCGWTQNASGGNSYLTISGPMMVSKDPLHMSYAACTNYLTNQLNVIMYDADLQRMGSENMYCDYSIVGPGHFPTRCEFKLEGNIPKVYVDGILHSTGAELTGETPSYVGFGGGYIDDVIWGDSESRYIFGMPENGYFLMKDILNPSSSGFYRVNLTDPNGTPDLISAYNFTSTFSKNSGNNETVFLTGNGITAQTYYTGTEYTGKIYWDLQTFFADPNVPYGLYRTEISPQLNSSGYATSDWLPYIGSGATIEFDKNSYAVGETATMSVVVSDGYYDTSTYYYHVVIQDMFGTEVSDQPITFSVFSPYVGSVDYTWTDDEDEGVYFGLIYARRLSDDAELLMNYDSADLTSTLVISGYVKDAETADVIPNATVNVTQGITTDSSTTGVSGNYTTTSQFTANAPTTIFANMSGYENYTTTFTPLLAGSLEINLTLMPLSPTYSGIALGGIARTPPYNRTIESATITIQNGSNTYTVTTNAAGYYINNEMSNGSVWDIWGAKSGFSNSSIYQKLVVGS